MYDAWFSDLLVRKSEICTAVTINSNYICLCHTGTVGTCHLEKPLLIGHFVMSLHYGASYHHITKWAVTLGVF